MLNVNELANSLKPVVLPGEMMKVFILKEGKEYNQGVAYLDDGTMVVVDNARKMISKTIDIVVTSVLQTTAGKMIFGRYIEAAAAAHAAGASAPATAASGGRSDAADVDAADLGIRNWNQEWSDPSGSQFLNSRFRFLIRDSCLRTTGGGPSSF